MKKSFLISILLVTVLLLSGCMGITLKSQKGGGFIYEGKRYTFINFADSPQTELFRMNYQNSDLAGTYIRWYVFPSKQEAYFSEFDMQKNIIFARTVGRNYLTTYCKEGFELPDAYECRINKITTGSKFVGRPADDKETNVWESENEFLKINDMICRKSTGNLGKN